MPAHALMTAPAPRRASGAYRIGLVCLGNICRSPMAEVVLRAEIERAGLSGRVEVDSAGTGDWHLGEPMDSRARAELSRRGYDGAGHRARQFEASWFERYDLVLAMDGSNLARLRRMAPDREAAQRTALFLSFDPVRAGSGGDLEVPDPYNGGPEEYALVFDLVRPAAVGLADQLAELLADRPAASG
ncbi:MAG TPA: low molecular weight protein-tyrosine-phosphatase [Streptosporangiaceae bacterium]|nr:low molecular weight protein-tyrosine-phosphatase [Streptosporangiaceae bacterium]